MRTGWESQWQRADSLSRMYSLHRTSSNQTGESPEEIFENRPTFCRWCVQGAYSLMLYVLHKRYRWFTIWKFEKGSPIASRDHCASLCETVHVWTRVSSVHSGGECHDRSWRIYSANFGETILQGDEQTKQWARGDPRKITVATLRASVCGSNASGWKSVASRAVARIDRIAFSKVSRMRSSNWKKSSSKLKLKIKSRLNKLDKNKNNKNQSKKNIVNFEFLNSIASSSCVGSTVRNTLCGRLRTRKLFDKRQRL